MKPYTLVIICLVLLAACTKKTATTNNDTEPGTPEVVVPEPEAYAQKYTRKMTGMRTWGLDAKVDYTMNKSESVTYGHKFEVTVLDDTTVVFKNDTMVFVPTSKQMTSIRVETDTASVLAYAVPNFYAYAVGAKYLKYFYKVDSIEYVNIWQALGGGHSYRYFTHN